MEDLGDIEGTYSDVSNSPYDNDYNESMNDKKDDNDPLQSEKAVDIFGISDEELDTSDIRDKPHQIKDQNVDRDDKEDEDDDDEDNDENDDDDDGNEDINNKNGDVDDANDANDANNSDLDEKRNKIDQENKNDTVDDNSSKNNENNSTNDPKRKEMEDLNNDTNSKKKKELSEAIQLGGELKEPAFALLTGVIIDTMNPLQLPITRLPVILGRTHTTKDQSFVPLGKHKSISRFQFTIFYSDARGGRISMTFNPNKKKYDIVHIPSSDNKNCSNPSKVTLDDYHGYFAIECLGKNKITVSGKKLTQGQVSKLENGNVIELSNYSFYFLLPETLDSKNQNKQTIQISNPAHKRFIEDWKHKQSSKKQKLETSKSMKKTIAAPKISLSTEFDNLPVSELLSLMTDAIVSNQWAKRHSLLGSVISFHAVRDAAASDEIKKLAAQNKYNGISRADIMKWIHESPTYGTWAAQMLSRIEIKSYQSNIGKSLVRAGYTRTGSIGRHAKWKLPLDLVPALEENEMENMDVGEDENGDDKVDQSDNEMQDNNSQDDGNENEEDIDEECEEDMEEEGANDDNEEDEEVDDDENEDDESENANEDPQDNSDDDNSM